MAAQHDERVARRTEVGVFFSALALGVYPPALAYAARGVEGAFSFFAADAFYYLAVADRSVGVAGFTYDGSMPTNGFHPLWQLFLWATFSWFGLEAASQIVFAFVASALASSLGAALFATALLRLTKRPYLALLGAVPGPLYAFCLPIHAHYGASWSFSNGMESGFSMLLFGLLARMIFKHGPPVGRDATSHVLVISSLIAAMTLTRLDDVFMLVPFVGWVLISPGLRREKFRKAAILAAMPLVLIVAYLAYNVSYCGMLLPTSGTAKGGLALRNFARLLTPFWPGWLFGTDHVGWRHEVWRVFQLGVPLVACGTYLVSVMRASRSTGAPRTLSAPQCALSVLAAYVVLKGSYNLLLVELWHQGHWYFPISIMNFNALAVRAIERRLGPPAASKVGFLTAVLCGLVLGNALVFAKRTDKYNHRYFAFWSRRDAIQRALRVRDLTQGVVDFDDGIIAYSLKVPALSGLGFALDAEAQQARRDGRLFEVAHRRGYRLMASLNYPAVSADLPRGPVATTALGADYLRGQVLESFRFELMHRDPATGVAFIRFEPRTR